MRTFAVWLFYICVDLAIASIATLLNDQQPLLPFLATLAVLWIAPLAIGILGLLKFWLAYWLFWRTRMTRFYKAEMYKFKFPASHGHYAWNEYLDFVMTDPASDQKTVMKAGLFSGEIEGFRTTRPYTTFLAAQSCLEHAMNEYQAPPSKSGLFKGAKDAGSDVF